MAEGLAGGRVPQPHCVVQVFVAEIGDVRCFTDPATCLMGRADPRHHHPGTAVKCSFRRLFIAHLDPPGITAS